MTNTVTRFDTYGFFSQHTIDADEILRQIIVEKCRLILGDVLQNVCVELRSRIYLTLTTLK